jgi:N-acetyl sugar amidotransferase
MPESRPNLIIGDDGICQACKNFEKRQNINWDSRMNKLRELCDDYRREDGYYDCVVPVSGGKDSHYLTYMMKEQLNMNPLLVTVGDPFTKTDAGVHNLNILKNDLKCDHIQFDISYDTFRKATQIGFEQLGEPLRFVETAIYTMPVRIAFELNIPMVIYGENSAYEYGTTAEESYSAYQAIQNKSESLEVEFWLDQDGITEEDVNAIETPAERIPSENEIEPIFMSYFVPWNGYRNYRVAKRNGFKDVSNEWNRRGHLSDYDQIDSVAYIVHLWMKYPKFGFARATDITSRWIRHGFIDREEAKRIVMEHDGQLDQFALDDFIDFLGISGKDFWDVADQFWNEDLFEKNANDDWILKDPVYADLREESSALGLSSLSGIRL